MKYNVPILILSSIVVIGAGGFFLYHRVSRPMSMSGGGYALNTVASPQMAVSRDMAFRAVGEESAPAAMPDMMLAPSGAPQPMSPSDRMMIRSAGLTMISKDVEGTIGAIIAYAEAQGGFLVTSNIETRQSVPTGFATVRLPSDNFATHMEALKGMGEVTSEQTHGQDITAEFVDLDSQLRNYRATETQLLEIMRRATEIEDVLGVLQQLTFVRGYIEQIEGRMNYLSESSDFGTFTVYVSADPSFLPILDTQDKWRPLGIARDALRSLVSLGQGALNGLIWFIVFTPLWLAIGALVFALRRVVKRNNT